MQPGVVDVTANVPSTIASLDRMKNCTPRLACASVKFSGSVGLSDGSPGAVALNVRVAVSTPTSRGTSAPDAARSGVT